ncbi:MAG TPA: CsbD family protein [Rhodocyclaceae bacterium]
MNKDQVKGTAKHLAGKVQKKSGELTGSTEQQVKGMKNEAEGKIQRDYGDLKEDVKDTRRHH